MALTLQRKVNESIVIGDDIEIVVVGVRGDNVQIGVSAPRSYPIRRGEIHKIIHRKQVPAESVNGKDSHHTEATDGPVPATEGFSKC